MLVIIEEQRSSPATGTRPPERKGPDQTDRPIVPFYRFSNPTY
jgi:hypothetical protein